MRHFYRSQVSPAEAIESADAFFQQLGMRVVASSPRSRTFEGVVGTPEVPARVRVSARPEGGHYTFVEATTDQMGESRLDRNVKRFFVELHRMQDSRHALEASY